MNWLINKIEDLYREIKHGFQRMFRGYDDGAYWNLDGYLTKIALPVLKDYREGGQMGYPARLENVEEWHTILDKIIYAFELLESDEGYILDEEKEKKVDEGLALFGENFRSLWS